MILFLILHRSISDQCLSVPNPDFKLIKTPMGLRYGKISLSFTMHLYSADTLQRMSARIAKGSPHMGGHVWRPTRPPADTLVALCLIHWLWFDSFIWSGHFCIRWDDVYILEWAFLADTLASMRKGLNATSEGTVSFPVNQYDKLNSDPLYSVLVLSFFRSQHANTHIAFPPFLFLDIFKSLRQRPDQTTMLILQL